MDNLSLDNDSSLLHWCCSNQYNNSIITVRTGIFSLVKRLYKWWKDKCTTQQNNAQQLFVSPQVIDSFY